MAIIKFEVFIINSKSIHLISLAYTIINFNFIHPIRRFNFIHPIRRCEPSLKNPPLLLAELSIKVCFQVFSASQTDLKDFFLPISSAKQDFTNRLLLKAFKSLHGYS